MMKNICNDIHWHNLKIRLRRGNFRTTFDACNVLANYIENLERQIMELDRRLSSIEALDDEGEDIEEEDADDNVD